MLLIEEMGARVVGERRIGIVNVVSSEAVVGASVATLRASILVQILVDR